MRIDWKSIPKGIDGFDLTPVLTEDQVDWSDPTHVPFMVAMVCERCGVMASCYDEADLAALEIVALDAMPGGRESVERAVRERVVEHAVANRYEEWLEAE